VRCMTGRAAERRARGHTQEPVPEQTPQPAH
jgi:hypothetical protein